MSTFITKYSIVQYMSICNVAPNQYMTCDFEEYHLKIALFLQPQLLMIIDWNIVSTIIVLISVKETEETNIYNSPVTHAQSY